MTHDMSLGVPCLRFVMMKLEDMSLNSGGPFPVARERFSLLVLSMEYANIVYNENFALFPTNPIRLMYDDFPLFPTKNQEVQG